jgi:hypothetical protein
MINISRMVQHQFSKQEVIKLLSQLRKLRVKYPPELLIARRRLYLNLAAQLVATHITVDDRINQLLPLIGRDPVSVVVNVLVMVFVAFLIAFIAHSIAIGNVDFGWLRELMSM